MSVSQDRVSQIDCGKISGRDVLARYTTAVGSRLDQAIHFHDGDTTAIT